MSTSRVAIPFNRTFTFGRIYSDTTLVALTEHRSKVIGGQAANKRTNPVYRAELNRLNRAIAARSN